MRKVSLILALTFVAMLAIASSAFAIHTGFDEAAGKTYAKRNDTSYVGQTGCDACHAGSAHGAAAGPHGGYTSTTNKCNTCHTVHSNVGTESGLGREASTSKLLPGETVTEVCNFCHDLTSSNRAPYYTGYLRADQAGEIKSAHKVAGLKYTYNGTGGSIGANVYSAPIAGPGDVIPGGDSTGGGTLDYTATEFFKQGDLSNTSAKTFTCDSCHTPHAISGSTVNPYVGESARMKGNASNRLLKKTLYVGQSTPITEYGSAWCAGCHQGRLSMAGAGTYNHPVNVDGPGYMTDAMKADNPTVNGYAYKTNAWYAMTSTDPITGLTRPDGYVPISKFQTSDPDTNGPSCQQCHASPRNVELAYAYNFGTDVTTLPTDTANGNPWAQSFPHVSNLKALLVQTGSNGSYDELCTNCHGLDNLP